MIHGNKWLNAITPQRFKSAARIGYELANKIDWPDFQADRPTILCIRRSQFVKDVEELRRLNTFNWAGLSTVQVKRCQLPWVPVADRKQTFFSGILQQDDKREMRAQLEAFAISLLQAPSAQGRPISAVLSANIDYWQDEALKLACQRLGIPFLVLCRENYTIASATKLRRDRILAAKFRFTGAGVAVFSEASRQTLLDAVDNADDIWVTGAPRYDVFNRPVVGDVERDHLALIAFNEPGYQAAETFLEVARIFNQAARASPNGSVSWLIKCKKKNDMTNLAAKLGPADSAAVTLVHDMPLPQLYQRSHAIVGYNSLAVAEAMLTMTPVILPYWGETRVAREHLLIDPEDPLTRSVANVATSPEAFRALLARAASGEPLPVGTEAARRELFARHLYFTSSGSAAEVDRFVRYYLDRSRGGISVS